MSTDRDWEEWGAYNPYFGVLSDPRFLGPKLNSKTVEDFYNSGKGDIDRVLGYVRMLGGDSFKKAVDFGAGTGRLTIPLTHYSDKVIGLDVSKSVLSEARKQTPKELRKKIDYRVSDDSLSSLPKKYDFVHSYIVLQHIPARRGEEMISRLLSGLEVGGFAVLHITFEYRAPRVKKAVVWLRNHSLLLHYLLNIARRRPWNMPRMRMHLYNLNSCLSLFQANGISETYQIRTDHGGYIGAVIIGRKL